MFLFQVEIHADDLKRAKIWQLDDHDDATSDQPLQFSRRIKNMVDERLRCVNVTHTTIMKGTHGSSVEFHITCVSQ